MPHRGTRPFCSTDWPVLYSASSPSNCLLCDSRVGILQVSALTCCVEPGQRNMRFQVHQFSCSFNSRMAELLSPSHGEQVQGRGKTSRAGALGRHLDKGRLLELLPRAAQPPDPGLLNFLFLLLSTLSVHFVTHRFTLSSRDLMLRKWILQVGSAQPSALTSPAPPPMRLASKWLGSTVPAQGHAEPLPGGLPCLPLFRRAFTHDKG